MSHLGDALILLSLACGVVGAIVGVAAGQSGTDAGLQWTRRLAYAYAASMIAAVVVMEVSLLRHDFSVRYVAKVGSLTSPTWVTIVSLWSSLEGSILFWGLILSVYLAVFTYATRRIHPESVPWALAPILGVGAFFAFLMAGPANPFSPSPSPIPTSGPGPNPLLQNHLLMVIHPPMLYLGYVGMTIPFGVAVAGLVRGQLGPAWLTVLRRALLVPWIFLTIGITLGGWWAYDVLGWGGYWAWDPVENASFLPWLTATAALHAAMLPHRKGALKAWTLTLVLASFLLTLLGTFMTRSGVFNSVHSFSQSDIGPTFLGFIAVVLIGSVVLLAARVDRLEGEGAVPAPVSRESAFLLNNLLFVALTFTVLVGTTFPLLAEAVKGVKLSVGEPYFNRMAVPIGVSILFLMGVGPALPWGEADWAKLKASLLPPVLTGATFGGVAWASGVREFWPLATLVAAGFSSEVTVRELVHPVRVRMREHGENVATAFRRAFARGRRRFGGYTVHFGIIVMIVAIAMSSAYKVDVEVTAKAGDTIAFQDHIFVFGSTQVVEESNRTRRIANIVVDGTFTMQPALHDYPMSMTPIGSPAVHSTLRDDLYVSLMSISADGQTVGLHLFRTPLVAWIWLGAGIVVLGGLMAVIPTRRFAESGGALPAAAVG